MFWLLLFTLCLSKLKYLVCFHNKAKSLIKMANFRKSAEYQAKEKAKKNPKPTCAQSDRNKCALGVSVKIRKECYTE